MTERLPLMAVMANRETPGVRGVPVMLPSAWRARPSGKLPRLKLKVVVMPGVALSRVASLAVMGVPAAKTWGVT